MVVCLIKRPHLRVRALLNNDQQQATRNNKHRTRPPKVKDAVHKICEQQGHKNDKGGQSQDKETEKSPSVGEVGGLKRTRMPGAGGRPSG